MRNHIPAGKPDNFRWASEKYPPPSSSEIAQIDEYMDYDAEYGLVFWRKRTPSIRCQPGRRVGTRHKNGYWVVRVKGRRISVSRIAWYFAHGSWPVGAIGFIDKDPDNMRLDNMIDNGDPSPPSPKLLAAYEAARQRHEARDWTQVDGLREAQNQIDKALFQSPLQGGHHPTIIAALKQLGAPSTGDPDRDAHLLVALS